MAMTNKQKACEIAETCGRPTYYGYNKIINYSKEDCFHSAMEMAKWKEQQMIKRAKKWLDEKIVCYSHREFNELFEDFKKAIKEE